MQALYFGDSAQPVYGVVHEPASATRSSAIVIHQPLGHEYFRTHRALTLLADQLAARGYYVMRYDYLGSGDSAGDLDQFTLSDWVQNARQAGDEILAISGAANLINLGVRFGASIAAMAALPLATRHFFWDPQFNGQEWLQSVQHLQQRVLNDSWWFRFRRQSDLLSGELLSARFSDAALTALNNGVIDTTTLTNSCCVFSSAATAKTAKTSGEVLIAADQIDWLDERAIDRVVTASSVSKHIVERLA
jgi:alpha/beta superfamily hydrolase